MPINIYNCHNEPVVLWTVNTLAQSYSSETECMICCELLHRMNQAHQAMTITSDLQMTAKNKAVLEQSS